MSSSRELTFPPLLKAHVLACTFSAWHSSFRSLTPKATVLKPLPQAFLAYLEQDGLFLPEGSGPMGESELSDSEEDDEDDAEESDDEDRLPPPSFPDLEAQIRATIAKYGGAVFPKLNWSAPQDAAFMLTNTGCRCLHPSDIYTLLKSSDFIVHDLCDAFSLCEDVEPREGEERKRLPETEYELVLKQWASMPRSAEWRLFVRSSSLVAVSQRHTSDFFAFLQPPSFRAQLARRLEEFWAREVRGKFEVDNYVLDVYVARDERLWVVDFNPFCASTDAALFDWAEILELPLRPEGGPELRVLQSEAAAQANAPKFAAARYPRDVVELSEGRTVQEFAEIWQEELKRGAAAAEEEQGRATEMEAGR